MSNVQINGIVFQSVAECMIKVYQILIWLSVFVFAGLVLKFLESEGYVFLLVNPRPLI